MSMRRNADQSSVFREVGGIAIFGRRNRLKMKAFGNPVLECHADDGRDGHCSAFRREKTSLDPDRFLLRALGDQYNVSAVPQAGMIVIPPEPSFWEPFRPGKSLPGSIDSQVPVTFCNGREPTR